MSEELATNVVHQEPLAFEEVYRLYTDRVNRYFYFRTHNRDVAQDLAQQMFLQVLVAFEKGKVSSVSDSFIFTIAHNTFSNYIRTLKRHPTTSFENIERVSGAEEALMKREAELGVIWKETLSLTLLEQKILQLRYRNCLPIHSIAKQLKMTENSIKLRLSRVRRKLKASLVVCATLFLFGGVKYLWNPLP